MKSRLSLNNRLSNKQKADIKEYCSNEMLRQQKEHTRRMIKLFCCALHDEFDFGKTRCGKIVNKINELANEHTTDEVFWYHVDSLVIDYLELDFSRENYEEMDR